MRFLRHLFMREDPAAAAEREKAKAEEVDELLAKGDEVLAEKDRVAEDFRRARAVAAYRRVDDARRARRDG